MNTTKRAALYLRSTKDRSDVSIDAQRRILTNLAKERGIQVITEFADPVVSGKSENRPGFRKMMAEIGSPSRRWNYILIHDSARLSREMYVTPTIQYECRKRGIEIIFSQIPDVDPMSKIMIENMFQTMDVIHSMISKEKGLGGMAENVNQGFRAGGRAPIGYQLDRIPTGAIRDGKPVTKSRLKPDEKAPMIKRYLKARAHGINRKRAKAESGIPASKSSLVDIEWNALTYAGHTVWNVRNEFTDYGYKTKRKRKPRDEWHINRNTHDALITDDEAEAILTRLENSTLSKAISLAKSSASDFLLTGIMKSPDGRSWEGSKQYYRVKPKDGKKGRFIQREKVDRFILDQLSADLQSDQFLDALITQIQKANKQPAQLDEAKPLHKRINEIDSMISKAMDLVLKMDDPEPATRKIDELQAEKKAIEIEIASLDRQKAAQHALKQITRADIKRVLNGLSDSLERLNKDLIRSFIGEISLDPDSLECLIRYRFTVPDRVNMASPRGSGEYPILEYQSKLLIFKAA